MWCALIPAAEAPDAAAALALWALSYTPRVACVSGAVLLDARGCTRLWGGAAALRARLAQAARLQGAARWAWGASGLAALARARAGVADDAPLAALPLHLLDAAAPHRVALGQTGCRTLGDLDALPRAGVARRWGQPLLDALDRLHGRQTEAYAWVQPPETFEATADLAASVSAAPTLAFAAQRLLGQLQGWLTARGLGAVQLQLVWRHEGLHRRHPDGELIWGVGQPTRSAAHLGRLLAEHLARVHLPAPVCALMLRTLAAQPLVGQSAALWPLDPAQARVDDTGWAPMLERLAARLGHAAVRLPVAVDDQRLSARHRWAPALDAPGAAALPAPIHPEPAFVLRQPRALAHPPPALAGPERVDDGWWAGHGGHEARDYWLAHDPERGLMWLYREAGRWYLHGYF